MKEDCSNMSMHAGRAGRVRPGYCFRLCTEEAFRALPDNSVPEMQRCELASTVLQLKALGIDNVMKFDWLAPPPAETMIRALELLHALGALGNDARYASQIVKDCGQLVNHMWPCLTSALTLLHCGYLL